MDRKTALVIALLIILITASSSELKKRGVAPTLPYDPFEHTPVEVPETTAHWQGEMAGEVSQGSVILQARLTEDGKIRAGDVEGRPGIGAFALSPREDFRDAFRTRWMVASAEGDYIIKKKVTGLEPGTRYYYRLLSGMNVDAVEAGPTGTFRTLDGEGVSHEVNFVAVTSMNRFAFRATALKDLAFEDRSLGFPALETIVSHTPDFLVATGDNVYYDTPFIGRAKTRESMRAKWHRQFAAPRFATLFQRVPVYWQKDDHDFRYNDADPHAAVEPPAELGAKIFIEQVPVVDPNDENPVTYRTYRINDLLQIWLVEVRDYRDPNTKPPAPNKTIWGAEQKAWLKSTLLESDTTFKILVSPTPMVGPDDRLTEVQGGLLAPFFGGAAIGQMDDNRRRDSHTTRYGFKDEADAFFDWLTKHGFLSQNFYIICGDRHWQYHSIHPSGFEEFSTGAVTDGSARPGRAPGDPLSTDPEGLISQPYLQEEASGGFLEVTVQPPEGEKPAIARFSFFDKDGARLYSTEKPTQQ